MVLIQNVFVVFRAAEYSLGLYMIANSFIKVSYPTSIASIRR